MNWTVSTKAMDCLSGAVVKDGDFFASFTVKGLSPSVVSDMKESGKKVVQNHLLDDDLLVKCFVEDNKDRVNLYRKVLKESFEAVEKLGVSLDKESKFYVIKRMIIDNLSKRLNKYTTDEPRISADDFLNEESWKLYNEPIAVAPNIQVGLFPVNLKSQSIETLLKLAKKYETPLPLESGDSREYKFICDELRRRGVEMP